MAKIRFAAATAADDAALRALLRHNVMAGPIAVTFRREPSYFLASGIQGERAEVYKGVDVHSGALAGGGGRFVLPAYVNGQRTNIGYLADLRIEPAYRNGITLHRAFDFLRARHAADPLPLYTTLILQGNRPALAALAADRGGMPPYLAQGFVHTPLIRLGWPKKALTLAGVSITAGVAGDEAALFDFINREHARRQYAPHYDAADLGAARLRGLSIGDFMIARQNGRIIGALAGWDQHALRQIHVAHYHGAWRWLKPLYNASCVFTRLPRLPEIGAAMRHGYVALVAVADDNAAVFRVLLRALYRARRRRDWHYMVCALHERDPLLPVLAEYPSVAAGGHLFTVALDQHGITPDERVPYIEAAAL